MMEEPVWEQRDWDWDPIQMVARPAESKSRVARAHHEKGSHSSDLSEEHKLAKAATGCQVRRRSGGAGRGRV